MNKDIINLADTIQGEINRMCVTHEFAELKNMYVYANINLERLLKMIYVHRFINAESEDK